MSRAVRRYRTSGSWNSAPHSYSLQILQVSSFILTFIPSETFRELLSNPLAKVNSLPGLIRLRGSAAIKTFPCFASGFHRSLFRACLSAPIVRPSAFIIHRFWLSFIVHRSSLIV
jgi:hypothetical protein